MVMLGGDMDRLLSFIYIWLSSDLETCEIEAESSPANVAWDQNGDLKLTLKCESKCFYTCLNFDSYIIERPYV